jgi:CyaY protein
MIPAIKVRRHACEPRPKTALRAAHTLDFKFFIFGSLSVMSATPAASPLSDVAYQALTRAVLDRIEAAADAWLEDDTVDIDTHRTGGLLELSFPNGSKMVLNTQPPLQELWLAARAGGYHFRYCEGRWLDTREGIEFHELLSAQASAQAGRPLSFTPP